MSSANLIWGHLLLGMLAALACGGMVQAQEFETANPDLKLRRDNTLRYNLGVRTEGRDSALANNATYDESDSKFDRGGVVTNRVDLMSEFELTCREYHGFRVSGAAWYDQAYADTDVETASGNVYYAGAGAGSSTSSYSGRHCSGFTKRYHRGLSGELLDAFAFTRFNLGDVPISVRAGRHTVYWGNGVLIAGHAVSYSQAPLDGRKAVSSPGTETREIFLPLGSYPPRPSSPRTCPSPPSISSSGSRPARRRVAPISLLPASLLRALTGCRCSPASPDRSTIR
jgi:hypothetical protein